MRQKKSDIFYKRMRRCSTVGLCGSDCLPVVRYFPCNINFHSAEVLAMLLAGQKIVQTLLSLIIFILCALIFCLHVCPQEGVRSAETRVIDSCELPCGTVCKGPRGAKPQLAR